MALQVKIKEDIQEFAVDLSGGDQLFELVDGGTTPGDNTKDVEMYLTYGTQPIDMDHNNNLGVATATIVRITKIDSTNYKIEYVKRDDGTVYEAAHYSNVPDTGNMFCLKGNRARHLRINGRLGHIASGDTTPTYYRYLHFKKFTLINYEGSTIGLSSMIHGATSWKTGTDYGITTSYTEASDLKYTLNMPPYPDVPAEVNLDGTITPATPLPKLDTSSVVLHQPNEIELQTDHTGQLTLIYRTKGYMLPDVDAAVNLLLYIPKNCRLHGALVGPKHNTYVGPYAMVLQRTNIDTYGFINGARGTFRATSDPNILSLSPAFDAENLLPHVVAMGYAENGSSTVPVINDWNSNPTTVPADSTPAEIRAMTDATSGTIISRHHIEQVELPYELVGKFNTEFRGAVYAIDAEEI